MSSRLGRKLHLVSMGFWALNVIAANLLLEMEPALRYVVNVSIYANIVGHWSGWSAERPTEIEEKS